MDNYACLPEVCVVCVQEYQGIPAPVLLVFCETVHHSNYVPIISFEEKKLDKNSIPPIRGSIDHL